MKESVDVILPNYNKVNFIDECLSTLQQQTHTNWRCIVIDGYSDDGSWERIQEVACDDDRFELYQLDRIGLYESWNFGLEYVRSPYFTILTSDDSWGETWLETAVDALESHRSASGATARTYYIDEESNIEGLALLNRYGEEILGTDGVQCEWDGINYAIASFFMGSITTSVHSVVVRSDYLEEMKFPVDAGPFADWAWSTKLGLVGDVVHCPHARSYWRRYEGQASDPDLEGRAQHGEDLKVLFGILRDRILDRLDGQSHRLFKQASREHLEVYFPYLFQRPSLHVLKTAPVQSTPRLIQLLTQYPRLFGNEMVAFLRGDRRYLNEKRKTLAEQIIASRNDYS